MNMFSQQIYVYMQALLQDPVIWMEKCIVTPNMKSHPFGLLFWLWNQIEAVVSKLFMHVEIPKQEKKTSHQNLM